jgi:DnaJ-domain-containing protein 1
MVIRLLAWIVLIACIVWWVRSVRARIAGPGPARPSGSRWDPYAVLGVRAGVTPDELTRAYRAQMKKYHPDRVADLPPEFQQLAHQKAIEIQRAYAELGGRA